MAKSEKILDRTVQKGVKVLERHCGLNHPPIERCNCEISWEWRRVLRQEHQTLKHLGYIK